MIRCHLPVGFFSYKPDNIFSVGAVCVVGVTGVVGGVLLHLKKVEVEKTYVGNPFLVTVADYDASFTNDPAYDDYGIVYNDRTQVGPDPL